MDKKNQSDASQNQPGISTAEVENEETLRSHDLFQDPAIRQSLKDDPVARLIVSRWKAILTLIAVVLAFFYMRTQIQETSLARVRESSQVFDQASKALKSLLEDSNSAADPKLSTEEKDKLLRSLRDSLANLQSGAQPYAQLSSLFASIGMVSGVMTQADIGATEHSDWKSEQDDGLRLIKELEGLVRARKKLDDTQSLRSGIEDLKQLVAEGKFLDLSALLALIKVAESDEDRKAAREFGAAVLGRYPEQAARIETELKKLL